MIKTNIGKRFVVSYAVIPVVNIDEESKLPRARWSWVVTVNDSTGVIERFPKTGQDSCHDTKQGAETEGDEMYAAVVAAYQVISDWRDSELS